MLNTGLKVPVFYVLFVYFAIRSVFKKHIFPTSLSFLLPFSGYVFGCFSLQRVLSKLQNNVSGRKESVSDHE